MLVRYNPFRGMLRRDRALPTLWDKTFFEPWRGVGDFFREAPKIEVQEEKDKYLLRAELPGYDKDEVKVEVHDGNLTLRAEHKDEKWDQDEEKGWRSIETRSSNFFRSIPLPEDVVADKIDGKLEKGVLRLTMPRDRKQVPGQGD